MGRTRIITFLAVVPMLATIAWTSPGAATTPPHDAAPVNGAALQAVSGTGTGTQGFGAFIDDVFLDGTYLSTGQLGSGKFSFDEGLNPSADFIRSDGARLHGNSVTETPGACGRDPEVSWCIRVDVTGSTDLRAARVQVAARVREGVASVTFSGVVAVTHRIGYSMLVANGRVDTFGGLDHLGDAPTANAVDLERTPSANGYWVVNSKGQVYAFGDAPYLGGTGQGSLPPGEVITSMSATPSGQGYWLFTSLGDVGALGDARYSGNMRTVALNGHIVGSVATPTGLGYYMVGSDGGVFAFGDARFRGSMGGMRLNRPIVGLVPTPDNEGYWLIAADGGVFSFGDARFHGSMGGAQLNRPIIGMVPYGSAYLMIASDGGVFNFSTLPFFGSDGGKTIPAPVVNGAVAN